MLAATSLVCWLGAITAGRCSRMSARSAGCRERHDRVARSNPAHVHLLLNHVPTVGFGLAIALFFVAHARRNDDLKRTGLVLFFAVAVVAIAAYLSGNAAESVRGEADRYFARCTIRAHEDAALLAFAFMEVTGLLRVAGALAVAPGANAAALAVAGRVRAVARDVRAHGAGGDARRRDPPSGDSRRRERRWLLRPQRRARARRRVSAAPDRSACG